MSLLTEAQKKLIELDNQKEAIKQYHQALKETIATVSEEIGVGGMFQDPMTSIVYEVKETEGKFVYFDKLALNRTKKDGEVKGSLSKKRAEENGFDV